MNVWTKAVITPLLYNLLYRELVSQNLYGFMIKTFEDKSGSTLDWNDPIN